MKEDKHKEERQREDEMLEILRIIAPGTPFREGLENILRARTGALIVIGDSEEVLEVVDGGFEINSEYTPASLYELAKMDGGIVISKDFKRFLFANTQFIPNPTIPTVETGTRHRTAERIAKQTNEVVICISKRRNLITIFKGSKRHILRDTGAIITRANQALQTLEKYRAVFDTAVNNLSTLEFEDVVTLEDVATLLQRTEMVMRIVIEVERYILELGNEGRLISMQLEELKNNVDGEGILVIQDYFVHSNNNSESEIREKIRQLTNEQIMDPIELSKALGYHITSNSIDINVSPKGYRILSKLPRLPANIIRNMVEMFGNFQGIINATIEKLDDVDGIGEVRARTIREGIKRIQEQIIWDNFRK